MKRILLVLGVCLYSLLGSGQESKVEPQCRNFDGGVPYVSSSTIYVGDHVTFKCETTGTVNEVGSKFKTVIAKDALIENGFYSNRWSPTQTAEVKEGASPTFTSSGTWYWGFKVEYATDPAKTRWYCKNTSDWVDMVSGTPTSDLSLTVSELQNPTAATATAISSAQINLSWTKWKWKHVLIVRKTSAQDWPNLVPGHYYKVGDIIGDGVVVYKGDDNNGWSNTGLSAATTYYYKLYSENYSYFSAGAEVTATTFAAPETSQDGPWNVAATWGDSEVPPASENVKITHAVTIPTDYQASCNDLVVGTGGSLTVQSDASGTGSLIVEGLAKGNVTVERFLTHDRWHYISGQSNISGNFNALSMGLTGGVNSDQFYRWNENTGNWVDILNGSNGNNSTMNSEAFVAGKGYAINYIKGSNITTGKTLSLSGIPYTTKQSIVLAKTTGSYDEEGANLVGNPFTSTIAVNSSAETSNNFLTQNLGVLNDAYVAVYLWNESQDWSGGNADYVTINNTVRATYIQPGQAFMVMAKTDGASLSFPTAIRKHGTASFYKSTKTDDGSRFELGVVNSEGQSNSTLIAFMPGMTNGLDPSYDAGKFSANANLSLYTRLIEDNGIDFAIQALPDSDIENIVIPVGVDVAESTLCEFSINSETMDGYSIYLQDIQENSLTNLKEHTYSTVVTESGTGRFFLHFKDVNGVAENSKSNLQVWSSKSVINIYNTDNQVGDIRVVNMFGQSVHTSVLNRSTNQQINLNVPTGYYIVTVVTSDGVVNKKVYL